MLTFKIFTYQFSPLVSETTDLDTVLFADAVISAPSVMEHKQETFQALFKDDSGFFFSKGEMVYRHQMLLNYNNIMVLRIANNKKIHQEENFRVRELVNQPSSLVIIDNRKDCQTIAVQCQPSSFSKPDQLAIIMESSFNAALKPSCLNVEIRGRIEGNTFWKIVDSHPEGIKSVRFEISYPNLPRVSDNVDSLLKEACKEFGANSKYEINAIQGQTLNLSRSSALLSGLVEASSNSGHPIKMLAAGTHSRWISTQTDSAVFMEIAENKLTGEDDLFNGKYETVAQEMNRFK